MFTEKDRDRFYNRVKKIDGCLIWQGHLDINGYGRFSVHTNGKVKNYTAHRFALILALDKDLDKGLLARHLCNNTSCVNIIHIVEGDHYDNSLDAVDNNTISKLNHNQIKEIRSSSIVSNKALANKYGVTPANIHYIKKYKSWKAL